MRQLLDDIVADRTEVAHLVAVDQVNRAFLAAGYEHMWDGTRLIREQQNTARRKVEVVRVEYRLIRRREVIERHHAKARRNLEQGVAVVVAAVVGVEYAIACCEIEIAQTIDGWGRAAHPDATLTAIRRRIKDGDLLQRVSVVAQHPSMIGSMSPCDES